MKRTQPKFGWGIGFATGSSGVYLLSVVTGMRNSIVLTLLAAAWISFVWLTIRILKDPFITRKTFQEQFYLDRDDICH